MSARRRTVAGDTAAMRRSWAKQARAALPARPRTDDECWPHPCRDYHDTDLHITGESPCSCRCHRAAAE